MRTPNSSQTRTHAHTASGEWWAGRGGGRGWPGLAYVSQCQHKFHSTFDMTTIKSNGQAKRIRFHSHSHAHAHSHWHSLTHSHHNHITFTLSLSLAATDNLKSCPMQIQITRANQNRQIVSAKLDEFSSTPLQSCPCHTPPPPFFLLVDSLQVQFKMLITTHDVYCLWNNWNQTTRSNSYELYYVLTRSRRTDRQSTPLQPAPACPLCASDWQLISEKQLN